MSSITLGGASLCVMPDCFAAADSALCEKHQAHLASARKRAEVLALVAARPPGFRARAERDPHDIEPGDYHPWDHAPWAKEVEPPADFDPPLLDAQPCPLPKQPSGVKQAVKLAIVGDWDYVVTYAIGPPVEGGLEIHSVLFRAAKANVRLSSRHEKVGEKPFGFKKGWIQIDRKMPIAIGWRDITAVLGGLNWEAQQANELRAAVMTCFDVGMDFEGVI